MVSVFVNFNNLSASSCHSNMTASRPDRTLLKEIQNKRDRLVKTARLKPCTSPRRCLFPVDRKQADDVAQRIRDQTFAEFRLRWNFDPQKLEPLAGVFAWEAVQNVNMKHAPSISLRTVATAPPMFFGRPAKSSVGINTTSVRQRAITGEFPSSFFNGYVGGVFHSEFVQSTKEN